LRENTTIPQHFPTIPQIEKNRSVARVPKGNLAVSRVTQMKNGEVAIIPQQIFYFTTIPQQKNYFPAI
jgi:hypothetical protein